MAADRNLDARFMRRAIEISRRGFPAPNPHVGCVICQGDQIVGEGYHHFAGGLHAEAEALKVAGEAARGAAAYVTLEPCTHFGRTPPCADALIHAGVRRVVVACLDPNPKAMGGLDKLRAAGIEVESGVLQDEAAAANTQFLLAMEKRRPHIVLKAASSLDGRTALPNGESKWITGPAARREGHRLRALCGAVLVGRRTVEMDDPQLTARIPGVKNQPVRIVLDPLGKLGSHWKVFDASAPTIHLTRGHLGVAYGSEGFDVHELAAALFDQGINGVLVEGGALTLSQFLKARLFDKVELFLGAKVLGAGPNWAELPGLASITDAPSLSVTRVRRLQGDIQISLRP